MPKIEYKVVEIEYSWNIYIEKELNKLGEEGWQLISIRNNNYYIFSRNKKQNTKETIL